MGNICLLFCSVAEEYSLHIPLYSLSKYCIFSVLFFLYLDRIGSLLAITQRLIRDAANNDIEVFLRMYLKAKSRNLICKEASS